MSDSPLSLPPPLKHPTSLSKHGRHPSSLSQLSNSSNSSSASAANSPSMSAKKSTWKRVVSPVSGSSGSTRSSGKESGSTNRTSVSPPPASNSPVKRSGSGILKSATGSVRKKDFGNVEKDLEGGGQTMGRRRGLSLRRTEGGRVSEEIKERNQRIIDSLNSSSSDNLPPPISRTSTDSSTSHFSSSSTTSSKSKSAEAGFLARSPSPKKIGSIRRKPRERESTGGGMEYFASGKRNSVVDLHSSDLVTPTKRGGKAIESDEDDTPKSGPRAYDALNSSSFSNPNPTLATTSTMRRIPDALATPRSNDREGEKGRRTRTGESKTLGYRNSIALSVDLKRTRDLRALGFDDDDDPLKRVPASASGPLRSFTSMSHYSSRERERDRPSTVEKEYRRASSRTSSRGDEDTKKSRRYSDSFRRSLDLVGSSRPVKSPPPPLPSTRARPKLPDFWEQQREESGGGSVSFPSSATSESWEKEREREVDYELVGEGEAPRNGGRWEHARPPSLSKRTGEYSRRGAAGEDEDVTVSSGGFSGGRRSAGGAPSAGGGSLDGYRSRTASLLGGRSTGSGGGGSAGAIERSRKTSVTSVGSGSGRLSGRYGEEDDPLVHLRGRNLPILPPRLAGCPDR
ncbi:hypothetical protein BT69DRAFT_258209 [Atractiella rhizophila]|nr:hypothetical protein BT69DRAFT_258209 [Atractiella rhizophila]